jgi:hypothetical protein
MISMTWTKAPADLLGLGSAAVRPCLGIEVATAPTLRTPVVPVQGTGVPAGGIGVRLRPVSVQTRTEPFAHTSIGADNDSTDNDGVKNDGTTLGIQPSRRPLS